MSIEMDATFHSYLSSFHPWTLLSGAGLAYLASWALFFLLVPVFHWFGLGWKLASAVAYGASWIGMLIFFALWIKPSSSPSTSSSLPSLPSLSPHAGALAP